MNYRKVLPVLCAALAVLILAGVFLAKRPAGSDYPVTRVSVILPHNDDAYWSLVRNSIEKADQEIGGKYNIDIKIYVPQLNYNIPQMIEILKQQVAARVDILVIQGNEDEQFRTVLEEARKEGIQIICVDTPLRDFPYDLYVGTDNRMAGEMIGTELALLTDGNAKVSVVSGSEGYLNLEDRLAGLRDAVKDYPGIQIQEICYDEYDGLTFMQLYHDLSEDADALVCLEGTGGQTLYHTYTERDDTYEAIVGFDSSDGVRSGVLDGVVKQDTDQMGRKVVEEIAGYIENGRYSAREIYTDIVWLTAENYDEVMKE